MSAPWKVHAEKWLMSPDSPSVLPTGSLRLASLDLPPPPGCRQPSDATFFRWVNELLVAGKLIEVNKGVYINRLGHRAETAAAAASFIRRCAIVSLSYVLEQAGLTNNFGETITCIIPTRADWSPPQLSDRHFAGGGTFRFHALRLERMEPLSARHEDMYDTRFNYQRTTPEKALLDWICLANTHRSSRRDPPLDLNADELDKRRLKRLSKAMGLEAEFAAWTEKWKRYQDDPDVQANASRYLIG